MAKVYAKDGTYLYSIFPTWDAHHFAIEHRAKFTDREWTSVLAKSGWTEHAREDLCNERVCDDCYVVVARGGGTGGASAKSQAQAELDKRGVPWRT